MAEPTNKAFINTQITTELTNEYLHKLVWQCQVCNHDCVIIRSESRCLCGHRLKHHEESTSGQRSCNEKGCECQHFDYTYAQGSFMLKCRCKHKAVEHHPVTKSCTRCSSCTGFDSPFICNCDHGWADHKQVEILLERSTVHTVSEAAAFINDVSDINRWDLLKRGNNP